MEFINDKHIYLDWTNWRQWSSCSVTCGLGTEIRRRRCPSGGNCIGPSDETRACDRVSCGPSKSELAIRNSLRVGALMP